MSVDLVKEMFEQMVLKKDPEAIPRFYSPDFELHTNGTVQGYEDFESGHRRVYATPITYRVEYDEEAWVEGQDRVAGRVWITTKLPDQPETRIEVILIAQVKDGQITRLWEATYPDWKTLTEMKAYDDRK